MGANPKASLTPARGANLVDYRRVRQDVLLGAGAGLLDGLPGGGLNIAYEAIDRHVKAGRGDKLALRWIGRDDSVRDFTYAALGAAVNRFANVLAQRGIRKGDRVSSLLGRVPELYIAALGTLKNRQRVRRRCFRRSGQSRSRRA